MRKPNHSDGSFTVRGKVAGVSIEKIYPLSFPNFAQVLLLDEFKIRRAKLYYVRDKVGRDAKMKSVLTQSERGLDLMKLAKEEISALQAVYAPVVQEALVEEVVEQTINEPVAAEEEVTTEETANTDEVDATVTETVVESDDGATEPVVDEVAIAETTTEDTAEETTEVADAVEEIVEAATDDTVSDDTETTDDTKKE